RVALTPEQVRDYGLPSTPLKATEQRAARWKDKMGVEQTEIDALATLQPDVLDALVRQAMDPFVDPTLAAREERARHDWEQAAQQAIDAALTDADRQALEADRTAIALAVERMTERTIGLSQRVTLPDPPDPQRPMVDATTHGMPLIDSEWPFDEQTRAL